MISRQRPRGGWSFVALLLCGACAHPNQEPASVEALASGATEPALPAELADAITHYQATGDIALVAAYVDAHPHDDLGIWNEIVALRMYEQLIEEEEWNRARAEELLDRYSGTYGAEIVAARLERAAFATVAAPMSLETLVAFLDGESTSSDAGDFAVGINPGRFRQKYEARLRALLERQLLETGCTELMAYCNWWVDRHPDAPSTRQLKAQMAEVWQRRAYPGWKNGRHHRCAYRCGTTCRAEARPLDDSCYAPCYAKCL